MKTNDSQNIVRELATATGKPEDQVRALFDEAIAQFNRDASVQDYIPLFAARKVRETLRSTRE